MKKHRKVGLHRYTDLGPVTLHVSSILRPYNVAPYKKTGRQNRGRTKIYSYFTECVGKISDSLYLCWNNGLLMSQ